MAKTVLVEIENNIAVVTLNRPEKRNAMSLDLIKNLNQAFRSLQQDKDIAVVILTGAGKVFSAGADLEELSTIGPEVVDPAREYDYQSAMEDFDRPVIGAINGPAATGGFELALTCDVLIASENAKFADTHARVGILPGCGLSQKLPRLIGVHRAKEVSLSGNYISAQQAAEWGLINRVVNADELLDVCKALAADMATCDRGAQIAYKRMINKGLEMDFGAALEYEQMTSALSMKARSLHEYADTRHSVIERGRKAIK